MGPIESEGPQPEEPTPEEKRRQAIEKNRAELARRREAGELDKFDYEVIHLWYLRQDNRPVTRKELGNKAIAITQAELEQLGGLDMILANGERIIIDPEDTGYEPEDPLIIFPEELGELKKET
jgi:hypothetical protein